ncbi:MAG: hypothetical protein CME06_18085 [Gemmatimonadetes bacterium]|nr:hypothetical protein [Gemmatimonadota bacterium]
MSRTAAPGRRSRTSAAMPAASAPRNSRSRTKSCSLTPLDPRRRRSVSASSISDVASVPATISGNRSPPGSPSARGSASSTARAASTRA